MKRTAKKNSESAPNSEFSI